MLKLDDVTLCCVDTRTPGLAIASMQRTLTRVSFAKALLFTDQPCGTDQIDSIVISRIASVAEYSEFVLSSLNDYIDTSYILLVQWDSWVLDAEKWKDEFLKYDYIGAPWPDLMGDGVGNGGFSLRSKRLLVATSELLKVDLAQAHPEDSFIQRNREQLIRKFGISFAPINVMKRFAFERTAPVSSFGFHGLFNIPFALGYDDASAFIRQMPGKMLVGTDARDLALACLARGWNELAWTVLKKGEIFRPKTWRELVKCLPRR